MTRNNIKYLKKDYFKSNYFKLKFGLRSKLIEINLVHDLTDIFLNHLNSLFKISCTMDEISNLHNKIDENLKVYDRKFGINKITNSLYDMPKAFIFKKIQL